MTALPDEIWSDILNYLDPSDLVSSQRISHKLLKLARDSSLWRNKVFEKAPSASHLHATKPNALSDLTGALGGLSVGDSPIQPLPRAGRFLGSIAGCQRSRRARAVLEWDSSHHSENIDWYTEYIARYAPLSTTWAENSDLQHEVRGMALLGSAAKVIGSLEDGSVGVWEVQQSDGGRRSLIQTGKSRAGLLFEDMYSLGEPSVATKSKSLGTSVENIHVDSKRTTAFLAVENILSEVDLTKMVVVSQNKFAWPITALSQNDDADSNLTVGTSFSLHLHDPRLSFSQPSKDTEQADQDASPKIAFFQNWTKGCDIDIPGEFSLSPERFRDYRASTNRLEAYARVEPGPQSILHRGNNEIVIAGRMPSILFYDRRQFPKPHTAIHSGARLSAMTTLPVPHAEAAAAGGSDATLIACGEYGGRGSLELYELPWNKKSPLRGNNDSLFMPLPAEPFSFRNRQEASSSKLLSVVTQGTRIVFSDSEGMLKWVERDGRGLARRWNINAFQMNERGASISGDKVVRKMIALPEPDTDRGTRCDGDLLIWTGERIGIVTTKPTSKPGDDVDALVQAFERGMDLTDSDRASYDQEVGYSTMMRRALERQADERRWMSRFGVRRW